MAESDITTLNEPMMEGEKKERVFQIPQKLIKNAEEIKIWELSETYYDLLGFINSACVCVQGKSLKHSCQVSPAVQKLLDVLSDMEKLLTETPPIQTVQRFGNQAFKEWYEKVKDNSLSYVEGILTENLKSAAPELVCYLIDSFGNPTRIDYGTGHELSFIFFIMGLYKIGVFGKSDELAVVIKVFNKYICFVRKLQLTYRMEPAGSHGVWSLDDYQFIPFIWGSAQLINTAIEPVKFVEDETINEFKDDYMFIGCIDYILQVKTGHIAEHSNQLWSISAVPSWSKICSGLIKMYQKEVLSKFPVIQHVLFGEIHKLTPVKPGTRIPQARLGMGPPPSTKMPPPITLLK
ncbi:unnamed protein product [Diamesa serratosioi]